jgi:hypothetical protein
MVSTEFLVICMAMLLGRVGSSSLLPARPAIEHGARAHEAHRLGFDSSRP